STDTISEIGIEESIPNKTSVPIKEVNSLSNRFYSPLVKSIAEKENLSIEELENIPGSGLNGRVQKKDVFDYLSKREIGKSKIQAEEAVSIDKADRELTSKVGSVEKNKIPMSIGVEDTIMEMDRVRKLIADHMVNSKHTAPHVTAMVEADVTNMVLWRNRAKDIFTSRYGEKLTYMPLFIEAVAKALNEFPLVNTSVDVDKIILRKHRNIGIAVAKPDGNLVVPVLKDADEKNLLGITRELNRLAEGARLNKLSPDAYQDGTFTITNFGSFKNLFGTPIINQPQVAILATGSIEKKPAVMETPTGDVIVVRHKMFLSLSYDHRIVDGALGGAFLRRIADLLEGFDVNHEI
ncbi:MAG: dihydrolipoamide acetyltransferase family protein, partial [Bacteroidota bacterium]|nr:dihydrolipoamide acetyltransferase family protein [Bacteroidota bacterium]